MKRLTLFLVVAFVVSCRHDKPMYYNHEKWTWVSSDMNWWNYETIRDSPVEVKEIFYDSIDMAATNYAIKFQYYITRKFDKHGNILFEKQVYPDSSWRISKIEIDSNGLQEKYYYSADTKFAVDVKDTGRIISRLLNNGIFEVKNFNIAGYEPNPSVTRVSFSQKGRLEKTEELFNKTIDRKNPDGTMSMIGFSDSLEVYSITNKYFDNNNILVTWEGKTKQKNTHFISYYYTFKSFPDSVVFAMEKPKKGVYFFVLNRYGDPIVEMRRNNYDKFDTTSNFEYLYDSRNNWIRRIKKNKTLTKMIVREIKY